MVSKEKFIFFNRILAVASELYRTSIFNRKCAYHNWIGEEVVTTTEFETGGVEVEDIGTVKKEIPKPIAVKVEAVTVLRCLWRGMGKANSNKMLYIQEEDITHT